MRTGLTAGAVGLLAAGPAAAFYFPGWPADGLPRGPTLLGPSVQQWTPPPLWPWSGYGTPPPLDRPAPGDERPPAPQVVPEPATLALAALGLGAVAVRRATRRPG